MHPVLLKLGPLSIHTYGFFVAMGFIAGILLAKSTFWLPPLSVHACFIFL
jgi:prolipoprotein diacylglyceryltransferase